MTMRRFFSLPLLAIALGSSACAPATPATDAAHDGSGDASMSADGAAKPSCEAIESACHPVEDRDTTTRECHMIAENPQSTEETCAMSLARCVAACVGDASLGGG